MKFYICSDCEDSKECFCIVPDGITSPDVCIFTKSNASWRKTSDKSFYSKLKEVETGK